MAESLQELIDEDGRLTKENNRLFDENNRLFDEISETEDKELKQKLEKELLENDKKRDEVRTKLRELYRKEELTEKVHIWRMRKKDFIKLFSKDVVPSYDSRVLVVGGFGAGKTTVVMNLIKEVIPKIRQSTDGIDVYFGKLLLDLLSGQLLRKKAGQHSFSKAVYQKILTFTKKNETADGGHEFTDESLPKPPEKSDSEILQKMHENIGASLGEIEDIFENVIPIPILDFAGQFVYLATHQTFLTSNGIYPIVFNGSEDLNTLLNDPYHQLQEGVFSVLDNIRTWVSSILTYSSAENKEYPKILFVATHKDLVKGALNDRRKVFLEMLDKCFTEEKIRSHLLLDKLFFVNALDSEDPEINELRDVLSNMIVKNPFWKKEVPKQFLLLEMMIAALVEEGRFVMSHQEVEELNQQTGFEPLTTQGLQLFLHIQHVSGKLTYLDVPGLREFVLINPTCLIDVLKSIVTAAPIVPELSQGQLSKSNLWTIWSSEKFSQFQPHKEYFLKLLVQYDVLAEVKRYEKHSGKKMDVDSYLVPSMITSPNKTTYARNYLTKDKCVSFVFDFELFDIPVAIPNRLYACVTSIWNIKTYQQAQLLFPGFVAVMVDRKHDLVIRKYKNTLAVYLVHKTRKDLIIRDLASSVRECLEQNLRRISEVYSVSFTDEITTNSYVPFGIKIQQGCLSNECFVDEKSLQKMGAQWICEHHNYPTSASDITIWYTDRTTTQCSQSCQGIPETVLPMLLSDSQLLRISNSLTKEEVYSLSHHLTAKRKKWDDLNDENRLQSMVNFYSLRVCREGNKRCSDFLKAMEKAGINTHTMCQIFRQEDVPTELPDKVLNKSPTDELIDKLCLRIGYEWMVLGLELGLQIERLEQIEYECPRVLREVSRKMLYTWRNHDDNTTIRELVEAFGRAGRNPDLVREILEECESYSEIVPAD